MRKPNQMTRLISATVICHFGLILLLLLAPATQAAAAGKKCKDCLSVSVIKKEDTVTVQHLQRLHIVEIRSAGGIGSAVFTCTKHFRGRMIIRLNTRALECLTAEKKHVRVSASLRNEAGRYPTPHARTNLQTGQTEALSRNNRSYICIIQRGGYCAFTLPRGLTPSPNDTLTISWIDYYR